MEAFMKFLILFLFCQTALADSVVFNQILNNNKNIDKTRAALIAVYIDMAYVKYGIPKKIYAAILMQESSYKLSAINTASSDYGISQINKRTAKAFGFNKDRLITDLEYSIEAGAIVLADFQRMYAKKDPLWFTRYNHNKPSLRKKYLKSISRWMTDDLKVVYEDYK
jgi:hypothetical protein